MVRNTVVLAVLLAMLVSGPAMAQQPDTSDKPVVAANTAIAIPEGCKLKVRWVCPPLGPAAVEKASWYSLRFSVAPGGVPWIGYQEEGFVSPTQQVRFEIHDRYKDFVHLDNGALLVATDSVLGLVVPPGKLEKTYDGVPLAHFQPIANLPASESRLVAGSGDRLYLVADIPGGGSDLYIIERSGAGIRGFRKVFSSKVSISAVGGDDQNTFAAVGGVIVKVTPDGKFTKVCVPGERVRSIVYSAETGLFFTTDSAVVRGGSRGMAPLLTTPNPYIVLRGGSLYVLLAKSLGVLALDNAADLKRFDLGIKEVPFASNPDVKVKSVRFFEAGKEAPEYSVRQYADRFDHNTTRYIYCQIDMDNLQANKRRHRQSVRMELYREGFDVRYNWEDVNFDVAPNFDTIWGWVRFGAEEAGSLYPKRYYVRTLLNGTLIDQSSFELTGEPTLAEAAGHNDRAMVESLLKSGADVNERSSSGATALMMSALTGNADIAKLLIKAGADVNAKDNEGETALTMTADSWGEGSAVAQALLDAGADPNVKGKEGKTPLHMAASRGKVEVVRMLLEKRADPDVTDANHLTPLLSLGMWAGHREGKASKVAELLIAAGADPDAKNADGNTALFEAVSASNSALAATLIERGADVNVTGDRAGRKSVLALALDNWRIFADSALFGPGLRDVIQKLQAKGAELSISDYDNVYYPGIDGVLDGRRMARLLEMSSSAARSFEPENPLLRRAAVRGLINAACRQISDSKDEYGIYQALPYLDEAGEKSRKWGLDGSCPELAFDRGAVYAVLGRSNEAKQHLQDYLSLAPTGGSAERARELLRQL